MIMKKKTGSLGTRLMPDNVLLFQNTDGSVIHLSLKESV